MARRGGQERQIVKREDSRQVGIGVGGPKDQVLRQVHGQAEPAFAFAASYLRLLAQELGLGALAVWFGEDGLERYVSQDLKEFQWKDPLATLLRVTTPFGPQGLSKFCALLRRHPEADRRCQACDLHWVARARKSGRSWTYQCHAGLTEIIAPIAVKGEYSGEVMGGQLACHEKLPRGFEDIWLRVQDIEGLDRAALEEAFGEIRSVDTATLHDIRAHLQAAARALGALVESVADLMSREALLGRVRSFLERDFAWFALTQPDATEREIASRARALGFSDIPSVVIVVIAERASRGVPGHQHSHSSTAFSGLFESAQHLLKDTPDNIVCSIHPQELVILVSPERTRNPSLRRLRIQELAARIEKGLKSASAAPLLVGVSDHEGPFVSLAKAYEEARMNIVRKTLRSTGETLGAEPSVGQRVSRMGELSRTVRQAARSANRAELEKALETQLRIVAECPEENDKLRQCLFTQMVINVLSAFRTVSEDVQSIDTVETRYALALPMLETRSNMVEWFHTHVSPLVDVVQMQLSSKLDRTIAKACELVIRRAQGPGHREDLADALGMSSTHFGKLFRAKTGITFRDFMRRLRISRAQKLLLVPGKTVADIASELGYGTTAAFSRAFEQVCGGSPRAYRNNPQAFARVTLPENVEA